MVNNELARAMHAQSGAERQRRARIIESEGERTSMQNYSEGFLLRRISCIAHDSDGVLQVSVNQTSTRAKARGNKP